MAAPGAAGGRRYPSVRLVGTVFRPVRWAAQAFLQYWPTSAGAVPWGVQNREPGVANAELDSDSTSALPAMLDAVDSQRTPGSSDPFSLETFMPSI